MKNGFQLLRQRKKCDINLLKSQIIPNDYISIANYFELGEKSFMIDACKPEDIDFEIPLTCVVYKNQDILLGIDYLYTVEQIESVLRMGSTLSIESKIEDNKIHFGHLHAPTGGRLYLSIEPDIYGQVYAGHFLKGSDEYLLLESNIHDFVSKFYLEPNTYQLNEETKPRLFKKWGDDFWSLDDS